LLDDGVNPLVVLRNTLYELTEQPEGAVTALQVRLMLLDEAAVAVKPLGAEGVAVQDELPEVTNVTILCAGSV
jgi:hypothetical protein